MKAEIIKLAWKLYGGTDIGQCQFLRSVGERPDFPVCRTQAFLVGTGFRTGTGYHQRLEKKSGEKVIAGYNFTDFNLKLDHRLGRFGTLSLLGYYGHDRLKMGEHRFSGDGEDTDPYLHKNENRLGWGNMLTALKWHLPINTLFVYDMKASYTRYQSDFRKTVETVSGREGKNGYENSRSRIENRNAIHDLCVDASLAFTPSDRFIIRLGTQYTHHRYAPEEEVQESTSLPSGNRNSESRVIANEWNTYLEGDLEVCRWLRFNAGLHGSFFRVEGSNIRFSSPVSRLISG